MSRTRSLMTVAAAVLAAVLAAGVLTAAPIGTTSALWHQQVNLTGVTVARGAPEPPTGPIVVDREDTLGDTIQLLAQPAWRQLQYTLTLSLEDLELPVSFQVQRSWDPPNASQDFMEHQKYFRFIDPSSTQEHYLQDNWQDSVAITDQAEYPPGIHAEVIRVAPGATEVKVTVRMDVAITWEYPTPFHVDGGTLTARLVEIASGVPIETVTTQLPRLWAVTWPAEWGPAPAAVATQTLAVPPEPVPSDGTDPGAVELGPSVEAEPGPDPGAADEPVPGPAAPGPERDSSAGPEPADGSTQDTDPGAGAVPDPDLPHPGLPDPDLPDPGTDADERTGPDLHPDVVATRDEETEDAS